MNIQHFSIQTSDEILSAFQVSSDVNTKPSCVLLHWAGQSNKERLVPIAWELAKIGISSIWFDFSGHGLSTSNTRNSIKKRIYEADCAIQFLDQQKPMILCGFSMSGQVVLNLLSKYTNISHIILFAPALYHVDALDIEFGPEFTTLLREHESWKNNNSQSILEHFTGKILIVVGSEDVVIPKDIPNIIRDHSKNASEVTIHTIEWAPHMLAGWTLEKAENAQYIWNILREFLDK